MSKVMVITGGSKGIGAATAELAAARGYAVCLSYLSDQAGARDVVGRIEESGGRALAVRADAGDEAETEHLFTELERHLGPPTALVNTAIRPRNMETLNSYEIVIKKVKLDFSSCIVTGVGYLGSCLWRRRFPRKKY